MAEKNFPEKLLDGVKQVGDKVKKEIKDKDLLVKTGDTALSFLPDKARKHATSANKEFWLAMESMLKEVVDAAERLNKKS